MGRGSYKSVKLGVEQGYNSVVEPTTEELKEELLQKFSQAISIPEELQNRQMEKVEDFTMRRGRRIKSVAFKKDQHNHSKAPHKILNKSGSVPNISAMPKVICKAHLNLRPFYQDPIDCLELLTTQLKDRGGSTLERQIRMQTKALKQV